MPKKIHAQDPTVRDEECGHPLGFPYRGEMPCTGPRLCPLCDTHEDDAEPLPVPSGCSCERPNIVRRVSGNRLIFRCTVCGEQGSNSVDPGQGVTDFTGLEDAVEMVAAAVPHGSVVKLLARYAMDCPSFEPASNQPLTDLGLINDKGILTALGDEVAKLIIERKKD